MTQLALRAKLDHARSYWRAVLAAEGGLWTLAAVLTAFVLCFHVDRMLVLSKEARLGVWALLGILFSGFLIFLVLRPLLQPRPEEEIAVMVEREYPDLRERLLSAVEFSHLSDEQRRGVSAALLDDVQAEAERHAGGLNFLRAFKPLGVLRASTGFALALLLLGLHLVFAGPAFARFFDRMRMSDAPVWRD